LPELGGVARATEPIKSPTDMMRVRVRMDEAGPLGAVYARNGTVATR